MNILGIYGAFDWDYREKWVHDSGATLICNGNHKFSISEERLTKQKYEGQFPFKSIEYCLDSANISAKDIDLIVYPSPGIIDFYKQKKLNYINEFLKDNFPNSNLKFISHHTAHAFASIYSSSFNEGSFLTLDGTGSLFNDYYENNISAECSSIGYFNKKKNKFLFFPGVPGFNNFGHFYQTWSHVIFCEKVNKEIDFNDPDYRETFAGKIMGLSAYGNAYNFDEKQYIISNEGIPLVSFKQYGVGYENLSVDDKSATIQKIFEDSLLEYIFKLKSKNYLEDNICFSGGVFLNILSNTNIRNHFNNIHIPPFTSDCGLHFGAASYGLFISNQEIVLPENIALLGKDYSNKEILEVLTLYNLSYEYFNCFHDLCEQLSQYLYDNNIVAWFQGRSEYGPRSLGSRSILTNAKYKKNKDILNKRVKHREYWRPFAGIILEDYIDEYFEEGFDNPYMLYSQRVKKEKSNEIESIIHEDGTCRIQTVNEKLNLKISTLLKKYQKISNTPILLNTSFNDNGQPIVETPRDAIESFINMDIDYIAIGNYIAKKNGN